MNNIKIFFGKYYHEILIFAFSFLSLSFLLYRYIGAYFPTNDDISLIVNSTNYFKALNPVQWFTEGYADYFRVYPEWSVYSKEIVRPVANIIFFANSLVFGKNFNCYLYLSILIHSLGISFVYFICRKFLKINIALSFLAAFIFFFTKAVTNGDFFFYSAFALDAAVSIFIFLSFIFAVKNKNVISFLFTILALLTKETSLLVPFAIAFTFFYKSKGKEKKHFIYAATVLLLWFIYKKLIGVDISAGLNNDIIPIWKVYMVNIARGLLIWPTGIPENSVLSAGVSYFLIFTIGLNLLVFVSLCVDGYREIKNGNEKISSLVTWSISSVILLIFFGLEGRFGYTFHMFFIPLVVYLFSKSKSIFRRIGYSVFCIWILISGILFFAKILNTNEIDSYKRKMQNAAELNEMLKSTKSKNVLLINDISTLFGTPFLNDFSESKKEITKINSISNYNFFDIEKNKFSGLQIEHRNDTTEILITIPGNTNFWFEGIRQELFRHEAKQLFKRNSFIEYCFLNEENTGISKLSGLNKQNFGKKLLLRITGIGYSIIWLNTSTGKYELIEY